MGLGWGWTHSLAWQIVVHRRRLVVWGEDGMPVEFPTIREGAEALGPRGWLLRRSSNEYVLDTGDDLRRVFKAVIDEKTLGLAAVRDRNGNCLELSYEGGRLAEVVDSAGRRVRFMPNANGRVASLRVATRLRELEFVRYTYDPTGNLTSVTDAEGHVTRYAYEGRLLTAYTNRVGVTFHYAYDGEHRCIETWATPPPGLDAGVVAGPRMLADGVTRVRGTLHYRFERDSDGYVEVASSHTVERFFGSPLGRIDKSVHGELVVTREYDQDGQLVAVMDGVGAVTRFERDERGRLLKAVDPIGRTTMAKRDEVGRTVEVTDPAGGVATTTYDRFGNIELYTEPDRSATSYRYDSRGLMIECVERNGGSWRMRYDEEGNWVELLGPNGALWRRTFDDLGRKVSETDTSNATTTFRYTPRGDLASQTDALGGTTHYEYDGERRLLAQTDALGARAQCGYGIHGKLCRITYPSGDVFTMRYTPEGKLAEAENPAGETWHFRYDARGNLIEETTFDGRRNSYTYDLADRVVRSSHSSGVVYEFEYNLAGELVKRELPDGSAHEFEYDALGSVLVAKNDDAVCEFVRDSSGRIVREIQEVGGERFVIDTTLDAQGKAVVKQSSLGHTERLGRDALGAPVQRLFASGDRIKHERDAEGREVRRLLPREGRVQSWYDGKGALIGVRATGPLGSDGLEPITSDTRFDRNVRGDVIRETDLVRGMTTYECDADGRLVSAEPEHGRAQRWRYADGRPFEAGERAEPREFAAGGALVRRGSMSYRFDEGGRLIEKASQSGTTKYDWNDSGLLSSVTLPDRRSVRYAYDAFGRRTRREVTTREPGPGAEVRTISSTRYVWDGDDLAHALVTEALDAGDPIVSVRTYVFDDDNWVPVAHKESGYDDVAASTQWVHYLTGPTATPLALVDASGNVVSIIDRAAFGARRKPDGTDIGLLGGFLDSDTGLEYHRFRYYDPEIGRFISRDPLEIEGGSDLFAYPPDPLKWVDPLGLARFPADVQRAALEAARDQHGFVRCAECNTACARPVRHDGPAQTPAELARMRREWQFDHVHPQSQGGDSTLANCQVLCRRCNRAKSDT
jgi:RHS repeat-associated protein